MDQIRDVIDVRFLYIIFGIVFLFSVAVGSLLFHHWHKFSLLAKPKMVLARWVFVGGLFFFFSLAFWFLIAFKSSL